MTGNGEPADALGLARTLRAALKNAVFDLEHAAATPAASASWREGLADRLHEVRRALIQHMEEVEAPAGLLARIVDASPQLDDAVAAIREEHGVLCEEVDQVLDLVDESRGSDPEVIRAAVLDLMRMLARHRMHGADVVYEAWAVDIGELDVTP